MSVLLQTATQCWWGEWWYLPAALLLTWLGIVGHELTHAVVMLPVAERVRLVRESDWALLRGDFDVESEILNQRWRHRWADMAGVAPLAIGLIVILVATITNRLPSTSSIIGLGLWNGWLWYTLLGGLSDYSPTRSRQSAGDSALASDGGEPRATGLARLLPEEEQTFLGHNERLLSVAMYAALAASLAIMYEGLCLGTAAATGQALAYLSLLLLVAALGLLLKRRADLDRENQ
jgi:hypothetical protein